MTCLRGGLQITVDGITATMSAGQTVAVLASSPEAAVRASAPAVMLRAWVPDLFSEIVAPARANAADDEIGLLGGPLADVRVALR
jgi:hypothetical protein